MATTCKVCEAPLDAEGNCTWPAFVKERDKAEPWRNLFHSREEMLHAIVDYEDHLTVEKIFELAGDEHPFTLDL